LPDRDSFSGSSEQSLSDDSEKKFTEIRTTMSPPVEKSVEIKSGRNSKPTSVGCIDTVGSMDSAEQRSPALSEKSPLKVSAKDVIFVSTPKAIGIASVPAKT
jgi:hypothetical protein